MLHVARLDALPFAVVQDGLGGGADAEQGGHGLQEPAGRFPMGALTVLQYLQDHGADRAS